MPSPRPTLPRAGIDRAQVADVMSMEGQLWRFARDEVYMGGVAVERLGNLVGAVASAEHSDPARCDGP